MQQLLSSFAAFNVNGFSNFIYLMTSNWSFFFLLAAAFGTAILKVKEQIDLSVCEEQNVL